jgi:hypothetical protein
MTKKQKAELLGLLLDLRDACQRSRIELEALLQSMAPARNVIK